MILTLVILATIAFIDLRPLVKDRSWKDAAVFLVILAATLALAVAQIRGVQVPSVMLAIDALLKSWGITW